MKNYGVLIPFSRWISEFTKEDSDRGILARWYIGSDFYRQAHSKDVIVAKLKKMGCSEFIIDTFENCWNEFSKITNAQITITPDAGRGRAYRKNHRRLD